MKIKLALAVLLFSFFTSVQAQTIPAYVPQNGLVGWWPFNSNANDESGNGNNGVVNGANLTTDRNGLSNAAYSFDGITSYINIGNSPSLMRSNTSFSISYWVYLNSFNPNNASTILTNRSGSNSSPGSIISITGTGNSSTVPGLPNIFTAGTNAAASSQAISAGSWKHIVHTYDRNTLQFNSYIDGLFINSATFNQFTEIQTQSHTFGREPLSSPSGGGNAYALNGNLDDIGLWNRVLTQAEVNQLFTGGPCITYQLITVTDTLVINANLTGLNPVSYQNTIRVYPNPSSTLVNIDFGSNFNTLSGYTMRIDNSVGQTVFTTTLTQQMYTSNLSSWTGNGLYLVYLLNPQGAVVDIRKIVIQ